MFLLFNAVRCSFQVPAIIGVSFNLVDVRDVAEAHLAVMENPNAEGRYLASGTTLWMKDLVKHWHERYPQYKALMGGVPTLGAKTDHLSLSLSQCSLVS